MKTLKTKRSISFYLAGLIALMAMSPASLMAQVKAGDDVSNTATVSYTLNDGDPITEDDTVVFEVDARINPVVVSSGGATIVSEQEDVTLDFTLTNSGNRDAEEFVLDIENPTGSDDENLGNLRIVVDTDGDGDFSNQTPFLLADAATNIVTLNVDEDVEIRIIGDAPVLTNGQTIDAILIAQAWDPTANSGSGGLLVEETSPSFDTVDAIFADAAGEATGDVAEDGQDSDIATLTTAVAGIEVTKTVEVVDGIAIDENDEFFLPGATVEYTITIAYTGSSAVSVGSVVMTDPIPLGMTYVGESITLSLEGAGAVAVNDAISGADVSGYNSGGDEVTVTIGEVRNGGSDDDVIKFRATID